MAAHEHIRILGGSGISGFRDDETSRGSPPANQQMSCHFHSNARRRISFKPCKPFSLYRTPPPPSGLLPPTAMNGSPCAKAGHCPNGKAMERRPDNGGRKRRIAFVPYSRAENAEHRLHAAAGPKSLQYGVKPVR
ncbi:hypothetical protein [Thauera butanivorans]|uniref:hypothetical protein n=1 Tax=Thauera butanivorans TaxID=86174 RepID=UPI0012FC8C99|nr:hypothetical protein [Thauera butanivorans]